MTNLKVFVLFAFITLLLVGTVSAYEIDNVKSYDEDNNIITITNFFGLGETIIRMQLMTPNNNIVPVGKDIKVAEIKVHEFAEDYTGEEFEEIKTYYQDKYGDEVNRDITLRYKINEEVEVPIYEKECVDLIGVNGTSYRTCVPKLTGYKTEEVERWVDFTSLSELPKKNTFIGLFADTNAGEKVEWIPDTWFGEVIDEWASWTASLDVGLVAYWDLDETTGTNAEDIIRGLHNGTNTGDPTHDVGIINNGLNYTPNDYTTVTDSNDFNVSAFSISAWIYPKNIEVGSQRNQIVSQYEVASEDLMVFAIGEQYSNKFEFAIRDKETETWGIVFSDYGLNTSQWYHAVATWNGTMMRLYINGTLQTGSSAKSLTTPTFDSTVDMVIGNDVVHTTYPFNGTIDEVGFWNRTLSQDEVGQLYNNGTGISKSFAPVITYPLNQTYLNTITGINYTVKDTSGSCWYSFDNGVTNSSYVSAGVNWTGLSLSFDSYNLIVYCNNSIVEGYDEQSFEVSVFTENSQTYNGNTTIGNDETFTINITIGSGLQVEYANLEYNGTEYSGTLNKNGDEYIINRTITIPNYATVQNNTFYWEISVQGSDLKNSTTYVQQVGIISANNCSTGNIVLYNFTIKDERTQTTLGGSTFNTTAKLDFILYPSDSYIGIYNYSTSYNITNPFALCLSNNLTGGETYKVDLQLQYDADGYAPEFYNIQKATITSANFHTNISLYDLADLESQEFVITYKDENFLPVTDALIQVQRKYIDEGVFKTVEVPKTDVNGETIAHLKTADAIYTFIVIKNGVILGTFDNLLANCESTLLGDCEINLNSFGTSIQPDDYTTLDDFEFTMSYDQDTREIQVIYAIPSSSTETVMINATMFDSLGTTQVCTDSLTSSSGTLTCIVPANFGNGTAIVKLYKNAEVQSEGTIILQAKPSDIYGTNIVFLTLFLYLTLIGIGLGDNPIVTGFFFIIGAVIGIALNLVSANGFLGATATVVWLLIAIIILFIKGAKRG